MAKHHGRKRHRQRNRQSSQKERSKQAAEGQREEAAATTKSSSSNTNRLPLWLLFLLGFGLYANTVTYEYVLDDKLAITHNTYTKKGFAGIGDILTSDMLEGFYNEKKNLVEGGRYRPLSMIMYAIEWEFFPDSPGISHFINAIFYGLTGIALYLLLVQILQPRKEERWYFTLPFVITALYLAHPLHTEVVANIKSRDEIMGTLGGLTALYCIYRFLGQGGIKFACYAVIAFFLALFSKESAVIFAGITPLTLIFFRKGPRKANWLMGLMPFAVAGIYFLLRSMALGEVASGKVAAELMNKPFMYATTEERLATILVTMGMYLKLLAFPHPLTHDYYPWHPVADDSWKWGNGFPYAHFSDAAALLPAAIYLALFAIGIKGLIAALRRGKSSLVAYSILLYLGTYMLFSNLFFDIGAFMNERFMYVPSLGFCIALGYVIKEKLPVWFKGSTLPLGLFALIAAAYSLKTFSRSAAWESDWKLSATDIHTSRNSAKANMGASLGLIQKAEEMGPGNTAQKKPLIDEALPYLYRSLELYPTYTQSMDLMGNAYFHIEDYERSIQSFEACLKVNPNTSTGKTCARNLEIVANLCAEKGPADAAILGLTTLLKYQPKNARALAALGKVYGKDKGDLQTSAKYLHQAEQLEPNNSDILQKLGVAYAMGGRTASALDYFQKALAIEPENAHVMMNIGVAYQNMGDTLHAGQFLRKAWKIDPSLRR